MGNTYESINRIRKRNSANGGLGLSEETTNAITKSAKAVGKHMINPLGSIVSKAKDVVSKPKQNPKKLFKNVKTSKPFVSDGTLNGAKGKYAEDEYNRKRDIKRNVNSASNSWK